MKKLPNLFELGTYYLALCGLLALFSLRLAPSFGWSDRVQVTFVLGGAAILGLLVWLSQLHSSGQIVKYRLIVYAQAILSQDQLAQLKRITGVGNKAEQSTSHMYIYYVESRSHQSIKTMIEAMEKVENVNFVNHRPMAQPKTK